jgi:hypothetical protein
MRARTAYCKPNINKMVLLIYRYRKGTHVEAVHWIIAGDDCEIKHGTLCSGDTVRVCNGPYIVHAVIDVCSGRRSSQDESVPTTTS